MARFKLNIEGFKKRLTMLFQKPVRILLTIIAMVVLISFVGKKHNNRLVEDVKITILDEEDNFFLDDVDIFNLMTLDGSEWVVGQEIGLVDLKKLENRLNRNPYLRQTEIYIDMKGVINVKAWMRKPLARIIPNRGAQAYLCEDHSLMPLSHRYSSRVMLLRGQGVDYIMNEDSLKSTFGQELIRFIETVDADPFLQAQIAEIEIEKDKEIILYPQVTKQYIEFGELDDFEAKIEKLNIFYRDILPFKGWNTYDRVSLKFKNQIVCE